MKSSTLLLSSASSVALAPVELPTPLGRDRRVFTKDSKPWTWKGLSAFPWCDRFARGDDLGPLLDPFTGYNLLRVWDYVTWPGTGWPPQPPDVWLRFLEAMYARGFYVELTLMTDDLPERYGPAADLVNVLAAHQVPNVVIEIGNEPNIHKDIDVDRLRATCEASGFQYASGLNDVPADEWFGSYLTAHTPRDYEWPRKCHDLLEYYGGGGPSAPTDPPHHVPPIADEPLQPERVGYGDALAYQRGDLDLTGQDYRAYFAGCVVMGGGGTYHWEGGKFGKPPTEAERHCAQETLVGLSAFAPGISNNGYRRIDEQGKSSRTYTDGSPGTSMLRIRPETRTAPEPGWAPLDDDGILWTRQETRKTFMDTRTVRLRGLNMSDDEENRFIAFLRERKASAVSLGNDGEGELFVAWTNGPTEDALRTGLEPRSATYL